MSEGLNDTHSKNRPEIAVDLLTQEQTAAFLHKSNRVLRFWRTAGHRSRLCEARKDSFIRPRRVYNLRSE